MEKLKPRMIITIVLLAILVIAAIGTLTVDQTKHEIVLDHAEATAVKVGSVWDSCWIVEWNLKQVEPNPDHHHAVRPNVFITCGKK